MSSATSNVSTESSTTTGIIILVVLVSLVVLAIAVFFFRKKNNATPLPEFKGPNVQPPSNAPSFNVGRPRNVP